MYFNKIPNAKLVIGDIHDSPKHPSIKRMSALGRFILDVQPEEVIQMGDWVDFASVNFFAKKGTVDGIEKPTIQQDYDSFKNSVSALMRPIIDHQKKSRKQKDKLYKPELRWIKGNHCYRIIRYINENSELRGMRAFDLDTIVNEVSCGNEWKIIPYKEFYESGNIQFTHVVFNQGKEIRGVNPCRQVALMTTKHTVYAHTHKKDSYSLPLLGQDDRIRAAINVGCFLDPGQVEEYAEHTTTGWWRGVNLIIDEGEFRKPTVIEIPVEDLLRWYS